MFDLTTLFKSFLGANTADGFVSRFADCYSADDGWRAYIIKGGPGTGKSSMMKQLAAVCAENGNNVELCPCSSDPDSLDAVIINDRKIVVMDGTAPHTVEPVYPGVCEAIVNLSDCWDRESFSGHEAEIIELIRRNKALHVHASKYIGAAGALLFENIKTVISATDKAKTEHFAEGLAERTVGEGDGARESIRFLSGITPKGFVFLKSSLKSYKTVIAIEDEHGAVSDMILQKIRQVALDRGQSIISCRNTVHPDRLDHLLIPSKSLAFCTEGPYAHPDGITRRIHVGRFCDMPYLAKYRENLRFNSRASEELLREAVSVIGQAKQVHDELEEYYIAAMDFSAVGELCRKIAEEIQGK